MPSSLLRLLCLAASLLIMCSAQAHETKVGTLTISNMSSPATPKGAKVAAGYMLISNSGAAADRLIGASSRAAARVELHEMKMDKGVMQMRELKDGLVIPANGSAELKSGGTHLMFMDLKTPSVEGGMMKVTLNFEKAGKVDLELHIRKPGDAGDHAH